MESTQVPLTPFSIEVDGVIAEVLEVMEHILFGSYTSYSVSLRLHYKGIKTKVFTLDCKDLKDLLNKLKIEISKIKFFEIALGFNELRRLIT